MWVTWFDPEPHAQRVELDEPLPPSAWPSCSLATLTATGARGSLGDTDWDLTWQPLAPPLPYLPSARLYDRRVPRSNGAAVVPHGLTTGRYGGVRLDSWHTVVGHNWGREHAEQWCWLHAVLPDGWLDVVLVRVRLGRALTPWIAGGGLCVDGAVRRTRPGRVRLAVDGDVTRARFPVASGRVEVEATGAHWVEWDYASPSGPGREVRNCSVADAVVRIDMKEQEVRERAVRGTVAVEHGRPS